MHFEWETILLVVIKINLWYGLFDSRWSWREWHGVIPSVWISFIVNVYRRRRDTLELRGYSKTVYWITPEVLTLHYGYFCPYRYTSSFQLSKSLFFKPNSSQVNFLKHYYPFEKSFCFFPFRLHSLFKVDGWLVGRHAPIRPYSQLVGKSYFHKKKVCCLAFRGDFRF